MHFALGINLPLGKLADIDNNIKKTTLTENFQKSLRN